MLNKLQPYPSRLELNPTPSQDSNKPTYLFTPGEWPDLACASESEFVASNYLNLEPST